MSMFQIENCSDVFVDACVRNEAGILMFLSVYGRDTAIKELMARMEIGSGENGLSVLKLKGSGDHESEKHIVTVGNAKDLIKVTGRLPKCLYGNLTHAWIFDPVIQSPDKGAGQAWIIEPMQADKAAMQEHVKKRIWQAICQLANIPLLPHWMPTILGEAGRLSPLGRSIVAQMGVINGEHNALFSKPLGDMVAFRVHLEENFPHKICLLVREGQLTLEPEAPAPVLVMG